MHSFCFARVIFHNDRNDCDCNRTAHFFYPKIPWNCATEQPADKSSSVNEILNVKKKMAMIQSKTKSHCLSLLYNDYCAQKNIRIWSFGISLIPCSKGEPIRIYEVIIMRTAVLSYKTLCAKYQQPRMVFMFLNT